MMTDESNFAKKIRTYLERGATDLKAGTVYRLQLARQQALARLADPQTVPEARLAGAGAGGSGTLGGRGGRGLWTRGRLWLGIAFVVAAGIGYQQWLAYQQLWDIEETDAAILSSDLPIDAYVDRGFQNWLKHASDED